MSSNITELVKIRKATSGSEKSKNKLSNYIKQFQFKIDILDKFESELRKKELIKLMNEEASKRKEALSTGVSSYSDPEWAGPSACETYTHCLLGENLNEIKQAISIIEELTNTNRIQESKRSDYLGYIVLMICSPLTFYFLNWWIGLIIVFFGLVIIGWKNRYD